MTIAEWVMSVGFLMLIGLVLKSYRDSDAKVSRLYSRLDETKKNQENIYVRKEVCSILHTQVRNDLIELKSDMKLLLKKNGIN